MDPARVSESENFITTSVIRFINDHIHSAHLSPLDDIVLNYVTTVLESLAQESGDLQDSFDVEEFCEMVSAYIPGFETIQHSVVTHWIYELVSTIRKGSDDQPNDVRGFESFLTEIESTDSLPRPKRYSESSSDNSSTSSGKLSSSRTPKISETSDGDPDADVSYIINRLQASEFQCDDKTETLLELFPILQKSAAQHFLATTNGDLEKAVQMVLVQSESREGEHGGQQMGGNPCTKSSTRCLLRKTEGDEKVLKDRIVARYGFIDQAEDTKEFRPPPLKSEPKKLVRYRESQVVSTKGERYSEVKCGGGNGEIKNYIYKPPKPY